MALIPPRSGAALVLACIGVLFGAALLGALWMIVVQAIEQAAFLTVTP